MALSSRIGNASPTALLRSASSLQNTVATYQDDLARYAFDNSAKTEADLQVYVDHLTSRANVLQASGTLANQVKATTIQMATIPGAIKATTSANIQRENINIMAGNATLNDKYQLITDQYTRAIGIGDLSLAQQLESQAYSVSQQIQYQQQQAQDAASTLSKANQTSKVQYQGDVVTNLDNGLKELNNAAKSMSEADFNKYANKYVQSNAESLKALGVVLPQGAQPNYFDIVQGVVGAKYNALVLKAQAEAPINPFTAANYAQDAQLLNEGATKINTLGGSLTLQEIQQAAQDPAMFAYNNSKGTYERTTATGYQFINGEVAPTYSGYADGKIASKFYYLTANETSQVQKLGLNINAALNKDGTVGSGVYVQSTANTPEWLKSIIGNNGEAQFFNQDGNLNFKSGNSFYTLSTDANGLAGLFQHMPDGSTKLSGGDYGFHADAAQMVLNAGKVAQQNIVASQAKQLADLKSATPAPLPQIQIAPPAAAPNITQALPASSRAIAPSITAPKVQAPTVNPQQPGNINLQGGGMNLQGGGGGIRLQ